MKNTPLNMPPEVIITSPNLSEAVPSTPSPEQQPQQPPQPAQKKRDPRNRRRPNPQRCRIPPEKRAAIIEGLKAGLPQRVIATQADTALRTVQHVKIDAANELESRRIRIATKFSTFTEKALDEVLQRDITEDSTKDLIISAAISRDKWFGDLGIPSQTIRVEHADLPQLPDLIDLLPTAKVIQEAEVVAEVPATTTQDDACEKRCPEPDRGGGGPDAPAAGNDDESPR